MSPPLDPAVVSELAVGVLWWWVCTARGWPPFPLYPLGACLIASWKFLKMSQWAGGGGLGGLAVLPSPEGKCLNSLPVWHRWGSQVRTLPSQGFTRLPHCLTKMRKFPKHNAWFRHRIFASLSVSQDGCLWQLPTPAWGCSDTLTGLILGPLVVWRVSSGMPLPCWRVNCHPEDGVHKADGFNARRDGEG